MSYKSIVFLGRQSGLSLAELEAVFATQKIDHSQNIAFLDLPAQDINGSKLGGTTKISNIIAQSPSSSWDVLSGDIKDFVLEHVKGLESGKITLGLSIYGLTINNKQIQKCLLSVKKQLKLAGRSSRIVSGSSTSLSDAQILHNGLLRSERKFELCLVCHKDTSYLAITTWVQDLDSYTKRDRDRPARDAKVGMLPPKLAQIIINLASAGLEPSSTTVLDPFCGTGVLLQEATLMGFNVYGTDIEPRMIDYSSRNLAWLHKNYLLPDSSQFLEVADASQAKWSKGFNVVACETYLGPPLHRPADQTKLAEIIPPIDQLHRKFLTNISSQLSSGQRLCIAVPAWATKNGSFKHLPTLDSLEEIGYNRLDFANASKKDLIYHREGQAVARELVVLVKE